MLREDTGRAAEGMEEMGFFSALGSALGELAGGVSSALDKSASGGKAGRIFSAS